MDPRLAILSGVVGYLLGAVSFTRIITHLIAPGIDLENVKLPNPDGTEGERLLTIGATTVAIKLGNDSGWDNSTVFVMRPPVESPDISSYLVLQMEFLAEAAERLGKRYEASEWQRRARDLMQNVLSHFWRGDHFSAVETSRHTDIESESLQLYLPLILGKRLPEDIRTHLVQNLKRAGRFLTAHGFATESLTSPHYRSRGYWRGPIWAAPTLILIDALMACEEFAFAAEIRQRFVDLVAQNGFAENFDAQTGHGYHDFHFSWTAGIWLVLAHELVDRTSSAEDSGII